MDSGIVFSNKGVLDVRGITTFGVSAKGSNKSPIGQFGTGLKYAIAVLLREKQQIVIHTGMIEHTFEVHAESVRNENFDFIRMTSIDRRDNSISNIMDMPFTTQLGRNWELWMAYRELYSNTVDESGMMEPIASDTTVSGEEDMTKIVVMGDEFVNVMLQRNDIFLDTLPVKKFEKIEAHHGQSNAVFHQGIRVTEFEKPTLYKYNITGQARLTEDRTLHSPWEFNGDLARSVAETDDTEFITKVVSAPEEFHESTLAFGHVYTIGETFLNTMKRLIKKGKDKLNPTAVTLYEKTVKSRREAKKAKPIVYTLTVTVPQEVTEERREEFLKGLNEYMLAFEEETGSNSNLTTEGDDNIPF